MCDPMFGMVMSGLQSVMGAMAENDEADYKQGVAQYNAREQENEAVRVRNKGTEEENAERARTSKLIATQRAQLAANGVDVNVGSAADLQETTEALGEADALRIRGNAVDQADSMERGAGLTLAGGDAAKTAGTNRATGGLLAGAGKLASKWYTPDSSANTEFAFGD